MPAHQRAGRPSKFSEDKTQIIVDAVANKMPLKLAAQYAMITYETVRQWMADKPDFLARIEYAKAKAAKSLIDKVCEDGAGSWKVLKNLHAEHFKDEVSVQQTNSYVIELKRPDGTAATLSLGVQPTQIPGSTHLQPQAHLSGSIGNPRGQEPIGSLLDAHEDSPGSKER